MIINYSKKCSLIVLLLLITTRIVAQDSTSIILQNPDEKEELINRLNGIQYIELKSFDKKMQGKRYHFSILEYTKGKLTMNDTTTFGCYVKTIEATLPSGKTVKSVLNTCSGSSFPSEEDSMTIRIAGKLEADTFNCYIDLPYVSANKMLKGDKGYLLRKIDDFSSDTLTISLHKSVPVLSYTPAFNMGESVAQFCVLGSESPSKWYEKFKLEHYYIFSLQVD